MAAGQPQLRSAFPANERRNELALEWRKLTRLATFAALLTSPAVFVWFHLRTGLGVGASLAATAGCVIAFRGVVDIVVRRFIPWPSLFGTDEQELKDDDVLNRRRTWFWRKILRLGLLVGGFITAVFLYRVISAGPGETVSWTGTASDILGVVPAVLTNPQAVVQVIFVGFLFIANFLIFFGPLMLMGVSQIRAYEPGDADWGVRLEDVRGQAEAKEEVARVVGLWQSGEAFERAGGKRERGLLMLGAPGTGKTMLSKALATGFNCPFVSIPGSGFAQTFIGMDAVIVRWLAWRAKRLARKWGGQCIVFIDEIDAVGMRRASLGQGTSSRARSVEDFLFFGPNGALDPNGELVVETRAWRDRLFLERSPAPPPTQLGRIGGLVNQAFPGGMFGGMGQLALNQLLVVMDGIGNPRFFRRLFTNWTNTLLDATYVIPRRVGGMSLRLPKPRPAPEQIYFIGACNVPIEALDPALTRPGRMGRHVWFRTPTKEDRKDIFDLYLGKVAHEPDLETDRRLDELGRITNGYSPAMIEQVCSMGLTRAHYDNRELLSWDDIVESLATVESGTAVNIEYIPEETRAVAIHEAGHAVTSHVFLQGLESTRLSIRKRGGSLGHHYAVEKEERFSSWQHEEIGALVHTLGAMAAERVFYGENSRGVGGDVMSATGRAALMVGAAAMAPETPRLRGKFRSQQQEEEAREKIMKRFERIGSQIMGRSGAGGPFDHDPIAGVLGDRDKRALAAQLLGQAYVYAHALIVENRTAVEHVAEVLMERREMYGNEVVELLDSLDLRRPEIDLTKEEAWPEV